MCDGGSYVYDPITTPGGTYQSGGSLGVQFGARRGWHSSSSGDRTAKGTAFDLAIELMMNSGRLGYSFELGYTRKDLSDFGGEGDRSTAFSLIPRIQLNSGGVGLYAGLGYLAFGFYDLPSGFGTEAGGYRAVGGVRAGLPLGLPLLNGVVVTVELQHEATLGDADFSSNAIVGGITAIVF